MRILNIVKTNRGAIWAYEQAKWLFDNYDVDIVTVLPSSKNGIAQKYKDAGMMIEEADLSLPIKKPWKIFKRIKVIKNLISKYKPSIIHCHFVTNILMVRIALRNSNIPRLFQVPGPLHVENNFFRNLEIITAQKNDYWAGACKKTCDLYLESGISKEKVFLAYYGGYGGQTCNEYSDSDNILQKEFNISDNKILIGMVSYFYKPKKYLLQNRGIKGHEDFIDAIKLVREINESVIGIIIGDAWDNSEKYFKKVKKYAKKACKDGIIFTGYRSDIKKIYNDLDIAVHPSHSENLGGAAESLAAGVPTISTDVGGFPDIVIEDETGYTVPSKNPNKLSESILKMISNYDEAKSMANQGQKLVCNMLDIENTGKKMMDIYNIIKNRCS